MTEIIANIIVQLFITPMNVVENPVENSKVSLDSVRICCQCSKTREKMASCGLCGVPHYCSVECQKIGWVSHKVWCEGRRQDNRDTSTYIRDRISPFCSDLFLAYTYHLYTRTGANLARFRLIEKDSCLRGHHYPLQVSEIIDINNHCKKLESQTSSKVKVSQVLLEKDNIIASVEFVKSGRNHSETLTINLIISKKQIATIYRQKYKSFFDGIVSWFFVQDDSIGNEHVKFINKMDGLSIVKF